MGLPKEERRCGTSFLNLWEKRKRDIIMDLSLSYRELRTSQWGKQVLFYDEAGLRKALKERDNADFLGEFGYSPHLSIEDCLDMLTEKYNCQDFPHEIGIFLGYPLKDIKGFIYKQSAPLAKATRWKVFGDPVSSLRLMRLHEKAEKAFRYMIEWGKDPMQFRDTISAYLQRGNSFEAVSV
jgi:hypothetical protein